MIMQASITAEPSATPVSLPDPRTLPSRRRSKFAAPTSPTAPQADKPTAPPKPKRPPVDLVSMAVGIVSLRPRDLQALRYVLDMATTPRTSDGTPIHWTDEPCLPVDVLNDRVGGWFKAAMEIAALRNAELVRVENVAGRPCVFLTEAGRAVANRQPAEPGLPWSFKTPGGCCPSCGTPPTIAPTTPTTVTTE
ncbi:MAG: hypothetical protein JNL96_14360 [Planctomycetaceae bacterium]|nr:hypothetical protein [Planctomycetaceae bacterium]